MSTDPQQAGSAEDDETVFRGIHAEIWKYECRHVTQSSWTRTLVTGAVSFIVVLVLLHSVLEATWLMMAMVMHEAGHYVAMKRFRYRNLEMFFIPLLGAAVAGERTDVSAREECITLIAGPVPGLILGCVIYIIDASVPVPSIRMGASWLVWLNLLNLLPFDPMDGGRLWNLLLFSKNRVAEIVFAMTGVLVLFTCIAGWNWVSLAIVPYPLWKNLRYAQRRIRVVNEIRTRIPDLPSRITDLSEEQLREIFRIVRVEYKKGQLWRIIRNLHAYAAAIPAPKPVAVTFGAVYFATVLLTAGVALTTNLGADTLGKIVGMSARLISF